MGVKERFRPRGEATRGPILVAWAKRSESQTCMFRGREPPCGRGTFARRLELAVPARLGSRRLQAAWEGGGGAPSPSSGTANRLRPHPEERAGSAGDGSRVAHLQILRGLAERSLHCEMQGKRIIMATRGRAITSL